MERWVTKFAYSRPLHREDGFVGMQFLSMDQLVRGEGDRRPDEKYLNLPKGMVAPARPRQEGARLSWETLVLRRHQAAWALVQDPEYLEALRRRIDDGKAPGMERLLGEIAERNAKKPEAWRPKRRFAFVSDMPPWLMDPLADREKAMIEKQKEQEEQEARLRQAAPDRQAAGATGTPEDPPDPDALELYQPEP